MISANRLKTHIKRILMSKLHTVRAQDYDVVNAIASMGVKNFAELDYEDLKSGLIAYMNSVKVAPYTYKYAKSCSKPCLYASIYAVMLEGILGVLHNRSIEDLNAWGEYLNSFQSPEDGLYYDPNLSSPAYEHQGEWNEGWGKHHLMGHIIIALARLNITPKYPLSYLEKYYDLNHLEEWMNHFDFAGDVWTVSNYFMNLYTVLEYARDYMQEERADAAIHSMAKWLLNKQNPDTGMWHSLSKSELSISDRHRVVRAAYHFYPLFEYEKIEVPYKKQIQEFILPLQNSWGGWTIEGGNAGACEDIDAIDPLLRYASVPNDSGLRIKQAVERSMIWQLSSRNYDGGFSFYVRSRQDYGNHPLTTSQRDESSMFATWFRTLCLAYEMLFLGLPNKFQLGRYPGYELPIKNSL